MGIDRGGGACGIALATLIIVSAIAGSSIEARAGFPKALRPAPERSASVLRPMTLPPFEVAASNGFSAAVFGFNWGQNRGSSVTIEVFDEHWASTYTAPGEVSNGRLRASFGQFGSVDVHFQRSGSKRGSSCHGVSRSFPAGRFTGELSFQGEGGYVSIPTTRVDAKPWYGLLSECSEIVESSGRDIPGVMLRVLSKAGTTTVFQNRPQGQVRVVASTQFKQGKVVFGKVTEIVAPGDTFTWSQNLKRARLTPPPPFSGTATYEKLGGGTTHWTGNLRVDFPGIPDVPLTRGPSQTRFEHGWCRVVGPRPGEIPGLCS